MKKLSLQWRLTLITTLFIAIICGCLTMFVYGSGVYYMDSLQETVDAQNTDGDDSHQNESISVYPTTNGMTSPMIFLYRYTIIKRIIKRKACFFPSFWRFLEELPLIISVAGL